MTHLSCRLIIGIITNTVIQKPHLTLTSPHPNERPFIISQNICSTYFVLRARREVGDTLFGTMSKGFTIPFKDFPVRKKTTKFYLSEIHKKQDFKSTVQVSNYIVFVFVTKKDKCIPNRYWFCLFDKGLNIW